MRRGRQPPALKTLGTHPSDTSIEEEIHFRARPLWEITKIYRISLRDPGWRLERVSLPGKAATWATVPWQRLPVQASSLGRNYSEWDLNCNLENHLEDFGDSPLRYINRRRITFPSQTLLGNHQDLRNQLERPRLEAGAAVTARQSRHVGDSPLA